MKTPARLLFRTALATIVVTCGPVSAAPLYWDTNGATAGSTANTTSVWGIDSVWSSSAAGDTATTGWTAGSDAYFSAGTNVTGTYTVFINGAQSANSLVFEDGTVTLNAGNSGGGTAVNNAGSLTIGAGGISLLDGLAGNATIGGSLGTLTLSASQTWNNTTANSTSARNISIAAGVQGGAADTVLTLSGTTVVNGANTYNGQITISGVVSNGSGGTLAITKTGANSATLSGTAANTYTGLTTVTAGTLTLSKSAGITAVAGDILVNGGTLTWGASNQIADTSSITVTNGAVNGNTATETFAGLTVSGGGFNTNTGKITVSGTTALSNGGLRLTVNSGGAFTTNALTLTGGASAIGATTGGNILIGGNAASISSLTVGAGGLNMSGQNIQFNQTNAGSAGSQLVLNGDFTGSGNNSIVYGTSAQTLASTINLGGVERRFAITGGTTTIGVGISNGSLRKSGTGTLTLTGGGTYAGVTNVDEGVVRVGHADALGTSAGGTVVAAGASVYLQGGVNVLNEALTITATPLTGQSAGLLNSSGSNTWGGNIVLDLTGSENNARINMTAGTLLISGNIAINSNASTGTAGLGLVLTGDGGTGTISGAITGTGASQNLIKNGNSTWVLSGTNTYSGTTRIDAGILSVSSIENNLGNSTTPISLGESSSTGTLQYTGGTTTITRGFDMRAVGLGGGVENAGSGIVTISGNVTSTGSSSVNKTFILSGAGNGIVTGQINEAVGTALMSVTKTGTGTWTIAGVNTYAGATTVTGGTLNISTSIATSSSVSATNGAIVMGGNGFIGDSASVSLGDGGILRMAGFSDIVGTLTTTGSAILDLTGGSSIITFANSSSTFGSGILTILGWNGSSTGSGSEQVNFTSSGAPLSSIFFENPDGFAAGTYSAKFVGTEVVPDALIPEPSTILTSILGAAALLSRRKRRD